MLKAPEINYYIGESQIIPINTVRYSAAKRQQSTNLHVILCSRQAAALKI